MSKCITVDIELFFGYSHYGSMDDNHTAELPVSDEIAAWVSGQLEADANGVTDEHVAQAIKDGEAVCEELHEIISDKAGDCVTCYWVIDAANDPDCEEQLMECFWEDLNAGAYVPEIDITEFRDQMQQDEEDDEEEEWADEDLDNEDLEDDDEELEEDEDEEWEEEENEFDEYDEELRDDYYKHCREHYVEWLTQVVKEDPTGYAWRMGVEPGLLDTEFSYLIRMSK